MGISDKLTLSVREKTGWSSRVLDGTAQQVRVGKTGWGTIDGSGRNDEFSLSHYI